MAGSDTRPSLSRRNANMLQQDAVVNPTLLSTGANTWMQRTRKQSTCHFLATSVLRSGGGPYHMSFNLLRLTSWGMHKSVV